MARHFTQLLEKKWDEGKFVCVGLDPDIEKIPHAARRPSTEETLLGFNRAIIDATKDLVLAYKPNIAFYEMYGDEGWRALRSTIRHIIDNVGDVPVILDAKRADIGNTNAAYAASAFEHLSADAVTVNPYMGGEPLEAFFKYEQKGIIVLCHTSNPGAGELQELAVGSEPLYQVVARLARDKWNTHGNCCVMVGATYPQQLGEVRATVGEMPILIAGVGAQDGDLEKTLRLGLDARKRGLIVNASRSITYASPEDDFAEAARAKTQELDAAIRKVLQ